MGPAQPVLDPADPGSADPATFNALQQRLNRKTVSKTMLADRPAYVIAYDILFDGLADLRGLPLEDRRGRLEDFVARHGQPKGEPGSRATREAFACGSGPRIVAALRPGWHT